MSKYTDVPFSTLEGEVLIKVIGMEEDSDQVWLYTQSGKTFRMEHIPDCCESVSLDDVCGDVADLIGTPILQAEEVTSKDEAPQEYAAQALIDTNLQAAFQEADIGDSYTWTFYRLSTLKGSIVLRWLGESNGYYSESVDFWMESASPE